MSSQLYRAYLKHQAESHPNLQHNDAGSQVFAMMEVEEAVSDLRTKGSEKGYIMRGLNYTYTLSDDGEGRKEVQGGFMIARHYSNRAGGTVDYFAAIDAAERVLLDLIEKIVADSRAGHPLFLNSLDTKQNFRVMPRPIVSDGYAGWLCQFNFITPVTICITRDDAPAWTDGGATPFDLLG